MRGRKLLDGLDLRVPVGARALLVSDPPGADSLLLGILAGLVRARRGRLEVAGLERDDDSTGGWRRRIAYLPPDGGFYTWLSAGEVLELAGRLAGYEPAERRRRVEAAVDEYRLAGELHRPVSRGGPALAQRVGLAAVMLGDPEVLLLDEPLRAVEDSERRRLLDIPGQRRTVLLVSRYPASEDGVVDRIVLIRNGRVALQARIGELAAHGLTLSTQGILALAELQATTPPVAASA
ncbi:MAG TPA: ATP-binding cassette domain-containing protein [Candidatus Limnocylindrales bacterium]